MNLKGMVKMTEFEIFLDFLGIIAISIAIAYFLTYILPELPGKVI